MQLFSGWILTFLLTAVNAANETGHEGHKHVDWLSLKEDMIEELEDVIDYGELKNINDLELHYYHFKQLDLDNNDMLDGLEYHSKLSHYNAKNNILWTEERYADEIDTILEEDDLDGDGYVHYMEYFHNVPPKKVA